MTNKKISSGAFFNLHWTKNTPVTLRQIIALAIIAWFVIIALGLLSGVAGFIGPLITSVQGYDDGSQSLTSYFALMIPIVIGCMYYTYLGFPEGKRRADKIEALIYTAIGSFIVSIGFLVSVWLAALAIYF
jgi:hypothetical protein